VTEPEAGTTTPAHDAQLLERTVFEVKRVIVGQDRLVERMLVGLLSKGHLLLEGVPGVAWLTRSTAHRRRCSRRCSR
jgi:MoxR-like ATPase